jgi:hypothetical protein
MFITLFILCVLSFRAQHKIAFVCYLLFLLNLENYLFLSFLLIQFIITHFSVLSDI